MRSGLRAGLGDGSGPAGGVMTPDLGRPGHGLTLRGAEAECYRRA